MTELSWYTGVTLSSYDFIGESDIYQNDRGQPRSLYGYFFPTSPAVVNERRWTRGPEVLGRPGPWMYMVLFVVPGSEWSFF